MKTATGLWKGFEEDPAGRILSGRDCGIFPQLCICSTAGGEGEKFGNAPHPFLFQ